MEQVIVAKNLKKVYDNQIEAVKDLNIEIYKGEVFGFLGPNGAGKSTSINMFTGIIKPTKGQLEILGLSIPSDNKKLSDKIGFVPQELVFYDHLTVEENLALFAKAYNIQNHKDRINLVLNTLKIHDLRKRRSDELSGGQKRRLNLAIGLLHTPQILFLDEPSAGMDPQSRNVLWETIEQLSQKDNITIVLTTHLMETADRLSDRIAIIDDGKVQVIDTPENLKNRFGNGDIIQLQISEDVEPELRSNLIDRLVNKFGESKIRQKVDTISITTLDGSNHIASLMELVETTITRGHLKKLSMHDNSLEDVFIEITGRELRE
ncbi:MAG: ABC transporter ATP-binding protein [Candidatus Kariarchaeaceae archaeon]|jgi:ABC-2 type transport system ATP-binding protein